VCVCVCVCERAINLEEVAKCLGQRPG